MSAIEKLYLIVFLASFFFTLVQNSNIDVTSEENSMKFALPSFKIIYNETDQVTIYKSLMAFQCDEMCSSFNNCCKIQYCNRSIGHQKEFTCINTILHGDINMTIDKCPLYYTNEDIVHKCQTTIKTEFLQDFLSTVPVTTSHKITYKNLFCALCNDEKSFSIWNITLSYKTLTTPKNMVHAYSKIPDEKIIHFSPENITGELSSYDNFNLTLASICTYFSIFFLSIQLIINTNKKKLQSLPNKIMFSFSLTLQLIYIIDRATSCTDQIRSIILHYLYLSYYTWLLVAAYDFSRVICNSSNRFETVAGKSHLKRFLIYCFTGWVLTLFLIGFASYLEFSPIDENLTKFKPAFGKHDLCFIQQVKPTVYFFRIPCTLICVTIIVLFLRTSYYVYSMKGRNLSSTAQNNYYKIFFKLSVTMGLSWSQCFMYMYTDIFILSSIFVGVTTSHGTIIFFTYDFEKGMIITRRLAEKLKIDFLIR